MSATSPILLAPTLADKLSSLGLIDRSGDKAIPGCELYQQAFKLIDPSTTLSTTS